MKVQILSAVLHKGEFVTEAKEVKNYVEVKVNLISYPMAVGKPRSFHVFHDGECGFPYVTTPLVALAEGKYNEKGYAELNSTDLATLPLSVRSFQTVMSKSEFPDEDMLEAMKEGQLTFDYLNIDLGGKYVRVDENGRPKLLNNALIVRDHIEAFVPSFLNGNPIPGFTEDDIKRTLLDYFYCPIDAPFTSNDVDQDLHEGSEETAPEV